MRQRLFAILILLVLFCAVSINGLADIPQIDLSSMTISSLTQFRQDIALELDVHHTINGTIENDVKKATEYAAEEYYTSKGITISWAWYSWEYDYFRDKDYFTFSTHLDYKDQQNKNHQVKIQAELLHDGKRYTVYRLYADNEQILTNGTDIPANHLLDTSTVIINQKTGMNLSILSESELKQLDNSISKEIDANHKVKNKGNIDDILKKEVENILAQKGVEKVDWPWGGITYTCDWNCYTGKSLISYNDKESKHNNEALYAELYPNGKSYDVFYLTINDQVLIDNRHLVTDEKALLFQKNQKYENATGLMTAGKESEAIRLFEELGDFEDSKAHVEAYQEKTRSDEYETAIDKMSSGDYAGALLIFQSLGAYMDSEANASSCTEQINQKAYKNAEALFSKGEFSKAEKAFEQLGNYKDSATRAEQTRSIITSYNREIQFDKDEYILFVGEKKTLAPQVNKIKKGAPKKTTLLYSSSNTDVITVNKKGTIKALKSGKATIHCEAADNQYICADLKIRVVKSVKSIKLNKSNLSLSIPGKKKYQLKATISPKDAYVKTGKWTSSNTAVATVDKKGNVKAVGAGTAVITYSSDDTSKGKQEAVCNVTVVQGVKSVSLKEKSGTIYVGKTLQLKASVAPSNAANKNITWTSSNEKVATVSPTGLVKGLMTGTAIITAMSADGVKATYKATVDIKPVTLKISGTAKCIARNHVGNSWYKTLYLNGKPINGTAKINVKNGDIITLEWVIEEYDKWPDTGSSFQRIQITPEIMTKGLQIQDTVWVTENGGRYSGYSAEWSVTFKLKP